MGKAQTRQQAYKRGLWAEVLAALWLRVKGYKVLKKRYKTPVGEIDLLITKGDTLIAVEVKSRTTTELALNSISPKSRVRIQKALEFFIMQNPSYSAYNLRFDVVAHTWPLKVLHLDNAWLARP